MKVLVVGSQGNMGRKYMAILKHLGVKHQGYDIAPWVVVQDYGMEYVKPTGDYDRAIIATPIDTHMAYCQVLDCPVLCEKPITRKPEQISEIKYKPISLVNNWAFMLPEVIKPESASIVYDYYNTGNDGKWDLLQPLYLSNGNIEIKTNNPVFSLTINSYPVSMEMVQISYVRMIESWLKGEHCWNMEQAIEAHKKVERYK